MTVLIPEYLQTKTYQSQRVRALLMDMVMQPGVLLPGDLKVSQRSAGGPDMSVDVTAGTAWVAGTSNLRQGLYHCYNDSLYNQVIAANSSGNPRIDQIVMRVYDTADGASAQDNAFIEVVQGTPTGLADLNNRSGAAALPAHSIRLADVLVPNLAASILNTTIRDRRPWATGAYGLVTRIANAGSTSDYTSTSTTQVQIDSTNLAIRVEVGQTGVLRVWLNGTFQHSASGTLSILTFWVDGGVTSDVSPWGWNCPGANYDTPISLYRDFVLTPGSHVITPAWQTSGGTMKLLASTLNRVQFGVQEVVRTGGINT